MPETGFSDDLKPKNHQNGIKNGRYTVSAVKNCLSKAQKQGEDGF